MTGARTLGLTVVVLAACNTDRSPTGAARADTGAGRADTGAGRAGTGAAEAEGSPARHYFGDAVLVDQNGERHRFYTDLVRDRTVIIDVFFTHCTASCPIVAGTFARVQDHLGERLGRDVSMLSISVDPQQDTPDQLAEYAQRFHARPGWYFLTGDRAEVEPTLRRLGEWVDQPNDHNALVLVGNDRTGLWKKALGLARPEAVIEVIDSVVNDRGEGAPTAQR
ncbi:MAG: SCO family protein [Deltaproteobacteria bacterium]|nr:MAG: SCO family protein [Deltaproteobacteria bacterium]TMQ22373.1 MAG: SCO family protein [Deltaproteobacteria bacterium]